MLGVFVAFKHLALRLLTVLCVPREELSTHQRRKLARQRGTLRCAWCSKLTEAIELRRAPGSDEQPWADSDALWVEFYCDRPACVAHRIESAPETVEQRD
jgi:hypothetical protein